MSDNVAADDVREKLRALQKVERKQITALAKAQMALDKTQREIREREDAIKRLDP